MNHENQSPRDWLLARHKHAAVQLDALRNDVLPKGSIESDAADAEVGPPNTHTVGGPASARAAKNVILSHLSPAKWIAAMAGVGAVLVIGFTIYETRFHRAPAPSLEAINLERADPRPLPTDAAPPLVTQVSPDPDVGFVAPASGAPAPRFPHRSPAQIASASNLVQIQELEKKRPTATDAEIARLEEELARLKREQSPAQISPAAAPAFTPELDLPRGSGATPTFEVAAPPIGFRTAGQIPISFKDRPAEVAAATQPAPVNGVVKLESVTGGIATRGSSGTGNYPPPERLLTAKEIAANAALGAPPAIWKPVSDWTNAGNATAADAMETWLWADVNRQPDVWLTTVALPEGAREKIAAYYQALPERDRARFGTPEKMYALLAMNMHPLSWKQMKLVKQTSKGTSEVVLDVSWEWTDGRIRDTTRSFHLSGEGWKIPLTDEVIEGVLNYYRSRPLPETK